MWAECFRIEGEGNGLEDREDKGYAHPTPNIFTLSHFFLLSPRKRKFSFCNVKPILLILSAGPSFYLETHSKTPTTKVLVESTFAHLVPSLPPTNSNFSKGSFSRFLPFLQLSVLWGSHGVLIKYEQRGWWLSLRTDVVNRRSLQAHTGSKEAMMPAQSSL